MFKWVKINDGHDNFFTPLRMLFAILVVIGHGYGIAVGGSAAELRVFYHYQPSYLAVNLFFIASGFLVTKSILYRGDIVEYGAARFLRIYPGLAVHVLFVMFIMGPWVTNLPLKEFLTHPQFYTQPLQVLTFYQSEMVMPGALETNPEPLGSAALWTLRYEILAYIGTAVAFSMGLMRKRWMLLAQFIVPCILWFAAHAFGFYDGLLGTLQNMLRFGICYGLGAAVYAYRDRIQFHCLGVIGFGILAALTHKMIMFEVTTALFLGYFMFWAAYIKAPKLDFLKSLSDTSYGIYIYHWGVMQWLFYAYPTLSSFMLIVIGLPITIVLAYASWHWIEKPILTRKKPFAEYLRFGRAKPRYDASTMLAD